MLKSLLVLLLTIFITCSPFFCLAGEPEKIFTVGVVPQFEVRKLHAIWRPILDQVEKQTGYRFKLMGSPNITEFERELAQGRFDFAYMNPYHLIVANKKAGYVPLLRDHGRKLYGILVVLKTSEIKDPVSLNGKTVAFPAPNALGASLMMRQELHDILGITIIPKYVKTHDSVYLNVLLGKTVAGGGVQSTLNRQKQEYRDNLRVIYTTKKVAPHPLAVLPRVPEEVRSKVRDAFLNMGKTDSGKAMLAKIPIKRIGLAELVDYKPLVSMKLNRFYVTP